MNKTIHTTSICLVFLFLVMILPSQVQKKYVQKTKVKPVLTEKGKTIELKVTSFSYVKLKRHNDGKYMLNGIIEIKYNDQLVTNAIVTLNGVKMKYKVHYYSATIQNYLPAASKKIEVKIKYPLPGGTMVSKYLVIKSSTTPGFILDVTNPANGSTINPAGSKNLKVIWTDPGMPADYSLYTPLGGHTLVTRTKNVKNNYILVPVSLLKLGTQYENIVQTNHDMNIYGSVTPDSKIRFEQQVRSMFKTPGKIHLKKKLIPKKKPGQVIKKTKGIKEKQQ